MNIPETSSPHGCGGLQGDVKPIGGCKTHVTGRMFKLCEAVLCCHPQKPLFVCSVPGTGPLSRPVPGRGGAHPCPLACASRSVSRSPSCRTPVRRATDLGGVRHRLAANVPRQNTTRPPLLAANLSSPMLPESSALAPDNSQEHELTMSRVWTLEGARPWFGAGRLGM